MLARLHPSRRNLTMCSLFPRLLQIAGALLLASCAHSTYVPEVTGPGAMATKGGVVYSIPPKDPQIKMNIVSLGVNKDDMLLVRMYFKRTADSAGGETLDPKEQQLFLPDTDTAILPAKVHAVAEKKPIIVLGPRSKQAIEMQFPVGKRKDDKYPYFNVRWVVHYKENGQDKTEQQVARFDRKDKKIPQGLDAVYDGEYPYADDAIMPDTSEWNTPGMLWW